MTSFAGLAFRQLQFKPGEDPAPKLRKLQQELNTFQNVANTVMAEVANSHVTKQAGVDTDPPPEGQWDITVLPGDPPVFRIRYNDGGTVRTGSITLS